MWATKKGLVVESFSEIDSTSTFAKKMALQHSHPFRLILADSQTEGRGRGTHQWLNSEGLLSTWCFQISHSPQPMLTPRLGLTLFQAMQEFSTQLALSLKIPNDLFLGHKKIAGLLVEVISLKPRTEVMIGLGLNVFSAPALDTSTFLASELSQTDIEQKWPLFLESLWTGFTKAVQNTSASLDTQEIQQLLLALNSNPHLTKPYTPRDLEGALWP